MQTVDFTNFWQTNTIEMVTAEPGTPIIDLELKPCPYQRIVHQTRKNLCVFEKAMIDRGWKSANPTSKLPFWNEWYARMFLEVDSFVFLAFMTFNKMIERFDEITLSDKFCHHKWGYGIVDRDMVCKCEMVVYKAYFGLLIPRKIDHLSLREFRNSFSLSRIEILFNELLKAMAESATLLSLVLTDQSAPLVQFREKESKKTKDEVLAPKEINDKENSNSAKCDNAYSVPAKVQSWYISPALGVMIKTEKDDMRLKKKFEFDLENCPSTITPSTKENKVNGRNHRRIRPRQTLNRSYRIMMFDHDQQSPEYDWKLAKFDIKLS